MNSYRPETSTKPPLGDTMTVRNEGSDEGRHTAESRQSDVVKVLDEVKGIEH